MMSKSTKTKRDYMGEIATLPTELKMSIATGMLESLGVNMYTSIGKSLAEFVANSYDADAHVVNISLPFNDIDAARKAIRVEAKNEVKESKRKSFTSLYDALPDDIQITIEDDGHGMHAKDIEKTFLLISRNRRSQGNSKTESGKRFVMGRKGLGKLAGFGTAEKVTVWTKREGDAFATQFTMDYNIIQTGVEINNVFFKPEYFHDLPKERKGTKITLSGLRCDSLKASGETVYQALAMNFGILDVDFILNLNESKVNEVASDWEYVYPEEGCDSNGFATHTVKDEDEVEAEFDIQYMVRFRAREGDRDPTEEVNAGDGKDRGSLPARLRGARIYCNGRLAAGPSLMNLETGMHNFHSQSYMECIVHADEIDRHDVDFIGTNRSDLKTNNSTVEKLVVEVTELMRKALYEHSKFRKEKSIKRVEEDELTQKYLKRVEGASGSVKKSAKKILSTLAEVHGVNSAAYRDLAPIVMDGMHAGDVLSRLIELETDPKSISVLADEFLELAKIENGDAMKLYRGRRSGIIGLETIYGDAIKNWNSGHRFEKRFHAFLKENPWLIHPGYSRSLTSDKSMAEVLCTLNQHLKIDDPEFAPPSPDEEEKNEALQERPDLVFLLADASAPTTIDVIELKSPNIPLTAGHLTQLKDYMGRIEDWSKKLYHGRSIKVHGYLIGTLGLSSNSRGVRVLHDDIANAGPQTQWKVLSILEMLDQARKIHIDALEVQKKEDERLEELLN